MTLTTKKIQKIIDLWLNKNPIETIALTLRIRRNTVKKYLWKYGYLGYSYQSYRSSPAISYNQQTRVPEMYDPNRGNHWGLQQAPPQRYEPQITNEQEKHMRQELENIKNRELAEKETEIKDFKQNNTKLTTALGSANALNKTLTDQFTRTDQEQKIEIYTLEWKLGELRNKVNEQQQDGEIKEENYRRELDKQKNKVTKIEEEKKTMIKEHHDTLEKLRNGGKILINENKRLHETIKTYKQIYNQLQEEVRSLTEKSNTSLKDGLVIGGLVGGTVGVGGTLICQKLFSPPSNSPRPVIVDSSKTTTKTPVLPVMQEWISQPDIHYTNSGVTPEITPSLTLCPGAIFNHNGENTSIGYNTTPSPPQEDLFQHDIQGNDRGVIPVTNISGILSPGAFSPGPSVFPNQSDVIQQNTHSEVTTGTDTPGDQCSDSNNSQKNACIGSTFIPNQTDDVMPSDTNNDVTFVTRVSGDQSLGIYCSSHFEIEFAPQDAIPVHIPSPYQIPINYYFFHLPSPLPEDLSEVYLMNKWKRTTGIGFETCIEKLFVHKGCPTERTPYGNYAGDLIVTLNGVLTLIECKQKPTVRVDTIQRTFAAKEHYRDKGVKHCMIITTGVFTQDAIDEAQILGAEIWDGKRLLEEIYTDQFFYLPENPEDYDPDK